MFFSDFNDLFLSYQHNRHKLKCIVYFSSLSPIDFQQIKSLKKESFMPDFILISTEKTSPRLKEFAQLGIHTLHPKSTHPSLIVLDIEECCHRRIDYHKTLSYRLNHTQDLDLYLTYKTLHDHSFTAPSVSWSNISFDMLVSYVESHYGPLINPDHAIKTCLIEDDLLLNKNISLFLRQHGFCCYSSHTPQDALNHLHLHPDTQLILLDIGLPTQTGDELLPHISLLVPDACIIMLSAYKENELLISCFNQGAHDYITKPFIPSELLHSIHSNLKLSSFKALTPSLFQRYLSTASLDLLAH